MERVARAGPDPARRPPGREPPDVRAAAARAGRAARSRTRARHAAAALSRRPLLRHRGRPVRARRRARLSLRRPGHATATFHAIWSRDEDGEFTLAGERAGFERLMDFFAERLREHPDLHIYHYAPYEPTALKRLMGRYGTREDEVDDLLRGGVLVDLLRAVRQSLRASVESYSIKKMEAFYGFTREIDLRDAGSSIVAFEQWLELGEGERPAADHLERIERYNRDDVVSNREAPRLARGAAHGAGRADRPGRAAARPARRAAGDRLRRVRRDPGARRTARGSLPSSRSSRPTGRPSSRAAGSWPSSSAGTGARTRPPGGSSTG